MRGTGIARAETDIRKVDGSLTDASIRQRFMSRKELYCNGGAVVRGKAGTVKNSMHTEALFLATSREGMGRGRPQRAWEPFCYQQPHADSFYSMVFNIAADF